MKQFLHDLIVSHLKVIKELKKQYVKMGGDLSAFGDGDETIPPDDPKPCGPGEIKNEKGECIPDPGVGK